MRKLFLILFVFVLFYKIPFTSYARVGIQPFIGKALPLGSFGELYKSSLNVGCALNYMMSNRNAIQISFNYNNHISGENLKFRFKPITLNTIIYFPAVKKLKSNESQFLFFIDGGIGIYFEHAKYENKISKSSQGKDTGINVGFGLEIFNYLNRISLILASNYHVVSEKNKTQFVTITFGIDFTLSNTR